jgi:hypothetical protein
MLWLGIAREHKFTSIGGWDVHVDHLHGRELLEHATWRQSRRQGVQAPLEGDVQAIGEEVDEDVRLDPFFLLVKDRTDAGRAHRHRGPRRARRAVGRAAQAGMGYDSKERADDTKAVTISEVNC